MIFKTNTPEETKQSFEAFYRLFLSLESSGGSFVNRGTAVALDFDQTDLTIDGKTNDLDLSSIIIGTAKAVLLRVRFRGAADNQLILYPGDYVSGYNANRFRTQDASIYFETMAVVPVSSGLIKYNIESTINYAYLTVCGWWT